MAIASRAMPATPGRMTRSPNEPPSRRWRVGTTAEPYGARRARKLTARVGSSAITNRPVVMNVSTGMIMVIFIRSASDLDVDNAADNVEADHFQNRGASEQQVAEVLVEQSAQVFRIAHHQEHE